MTAEQALKPPPPEVGLRIMSDRLMKSYRKWVKDGKPERKREAK